MSAKETREAAFRWANGQHTNNDAAIRSMREILRMPIAEDSRRAVLAMAEAIGGGPKMPPPALNEAQRDDPRRELAMMRAKVEALQRLAESYLEERADAFAKVEAAMLLSLNALSPIDQDVSALRDAMTSACRLSVGIDGAEAIARAAKRITKGEN